jgi:hypothetical protein
MVERPNAKPGAGIVGPARSPSSATLGSAAGFLLPNLPLGIFWFGALIAPLSLGIFLAVVWIVVAGTALAMLSFMRKPRWHTLVRGLTLILAPVMSLCIRGAQVQRHRIAKFLGYMMSSPYRPLPQGSPLSHARMRVRDPAVWRDLAYLLLLLPIGAAEFAIVAAAFALPPVTLALPTWLFVALPEGVPLGQGVWIDTLLEATITAIIVLPVSVLASYWVIISVSSATLAKQACTTRRARGGADPDPLKGGRSSHSRTPQNRT